MIVARIVQGVGAAALAPSTLALLATSFPEGPERTRAMTAYGAAAASEPPSACCSEDAAGPRGVLAERTVAC